MKAKDDASKSAHRESHNRESQDLYVDEPTNESEIAGRMQKQMNIINKVLLAKAKFKGLLKRKLERMNQKYKQSFKAGAVAEGDKNKLEEAIKKGREKLRLEVIDKCSRLRDLHPHLKLCLAEQMKFTYLSKGEVFKFRNYPNIDMFIMAEGRLEVKWYDATQTGETDVDNEPQTLFIRDFLDSQKLADMYPGLGMLDNIGTVISERVTIVTINGELYQKHYKLNEQFNRLNVNQFLYMNTPELKDCGLALKKKVGLQFSGKHCRRGEILEVEGQTARKAHLVLKGRLRIYKKLLNDEARDTNSRRRE